MERKLAEWRAQQQATAEKSPRVKECLGDGGVFSGWWHRLRPRRGEAEQQERYQDPPESREKEENDQNSFKEKSVEQPIETDRFILTIVTVLKFLLWLVLLGLFIELEFGLVFFVLSMFYWIYIGTRDPSEKKQGEVSAYSVFNPGCKAIEGSLTAEQFERELQYRPLAGR